MKIYLVVQMFLMSVSMHDRLYIHTIGPMVCIHKIFSVVHFRWSLVYLNVWLCQSNTQLHFAHF